MEVRIVYLGQDTAGVIIKDEREDPPILYEIALVNDEIKVTRAERGMSVWQRVLSLATGRVRRST